MINKFEYSFLRGDEKVWEVKGAAWNVVATFCQKSGYGSFGEPTAAGKRVIAQYEIRRDLINYGDV